MTLHEMIYNIKVQGAYIIKTWDKELNKFHIWESGFDFGSDVWYISTTKLNAKITHLYAINGTLHIEIDEEV